MNAPNAPSVLRQALRRGVREQPTDHTPRSPMRRCDWATGDLTEQVDNTTDEKVLQRGRFPGSRRPCLAALSGHRPHRPHQTAHWPQNPANKPLAAGARPTTTPILPNHCPIAETVPHRQTNRKPRIAGLFAIGAIGGAWLCGWRFVGPCAVLWAAGALLERLGGALATARRRAARRASRGWRTRVVPSPGAVPVAAAWAEPVVWFGVP